MTKYVFEKIRRVIEDKGLIISWISFYDQKHSRIYGPRNECKRVRFSEIIEWVPGKGVIVKLHTTPYEGIEKIENIFIDRRYVKSIQLINEDGTYYRSRTKFLF